MSNSISGAGRDHVELKELEIDLKAAGATFATLTAKKVGAVAHFTYTPAGAVARMGGAMEDGEEPEEAVLVLDALTARASVLFEGETISTLMQQGTDLLPLLDRHALEALEQQLKDQLGKDD